MNPVLLLLWLFRATEVPPLAAGTLSLDSSGPGGIAFAATAATGGVPAVSQQLQRDTSGAFPSPSDITGETSLAPFDSTAVAGTLYYYREKYYDSIGTIVYSNTVPAQVYEGGAISGGGGGANRAILPSGLSSMG